MYSKGHSEPGRSLNCYPTCKGPCAMGATSVWGLLEAAHTSVVGWRCLSIPRVWGLGFVKWGANDEPEESRPVERGIHARGNERDDQRRETRSRETKGFASIVRLILCPFPRLRAICFLSFVYLYYLRHFDY